MVRDNENHDARELEELLDVIRQAFIVVVFLVDSTLSKLAMNRNRDHQLLKAHFEDFRADG